MKLRIAYWLLLRAIRLLGGVECWEVEQASDEVDAALGLLEVHLFRNDCDCWCVKDMAKEV